MLTLHVSFGSVQELVILKRINPGKRLKNISRTRMMEEVIMFRLFRLIQ